MRRRVLAGAFVVLIWSVPAGAAGPAQTLAKALVVAQKDVPETWVPGSVGLRPVLSCLKKTPATFGALVRQGMGTPNSGVLSQATVFSTRARAAAFYQRQLAAVPGCVRNLIKSRRDIRKVFPVQALARGHHGVRTDARRIRYITGSQRHGFDWALINTGTAVLIDLFDMGIYDTKWHDLSSERGLGGSVVGIERRVLANAARRAAKH